MKQKYLKYLEKGMKFNRLTVIEVDEDSKVKNGQKVRPSIWKYICRCDCGKITSVHKEHLLTEHTKGCGCYRTPKKNRIKIEKDYIKIFFNNSDKFTIIDSEDYEKVKNYTWYLNPNRYTYSRSIGKKHIPLHRFIMNCPKNKEVDHINHDTLDNRKKNLRVVTHQQNLLNSKIQSNNTSGFKGVTWHKDKKKWCAFINFEYNHLKLGYFNNKQDAVKVRKEAEIEYFGEYRYKDLN